MTTQEAPLKLKVNNIISKHTDKMFEDFDNLRVPTIDIYEALTIEGEEELAEQYEEWVGAPQGSLHPDYDPTPQGPELVTDPGDSPSYATYPSAHTPGIEWPRH